MCDVVATQMVINQVLDVIWPWLSPHILEALAYV